MSAAVNQSISEYHGKIEITEGCTSILVSIESLSEPHGVPRAALVAYKFYDQDGLVVEAVEKHFISKVHGPFFYLEPSRDTSPAHTFQNLEVPPGAVRCELNGHVWNNKVATILNRLPVLQRQGTNENSEFLTVMGEPVPMPVSDYTATLTVPDETSELHLGFKFQGDDQRKATKALILVDFLGVGGDLLPPTGDLAVNPLHGAFLYLEAGLEQQDCELSTSIRLPADCRSVRLRGQDWTAGRITLSQAPEVRFFSEAESSTSDLPLRRFFEGMPEDDGLIVIYTTARAIGNGSLLLRSNRLALEYAKAGNWVVFFPFGSLEADESSRPHERILQMDRKNFKTFMDVAIQRKGRKNKFICSSFTDLQTASSIDRMKDSGWTVMYEVRDDMEEFNRVGYSKWFNPLLEARVAKRSDLVVAVSPRLREKISTIAGRNDVRLVPNAAPDELVESAAYLRTDASMELRRNSKKVGYIGHLTPSWFDWDLLIAVAQRLPQVDFEIIGHEFPEDLALPINVAYLGAMPHHECIEYAKGWRAGLIPFKISPLTYGVDPNKVYEYVALGLRTVSAPMGSVESIPGTWVYTDVESAVNGVQDAVSRPITPAELASYEAYITEVTWSKRALEMLAILEGV